MSPAALKINDQIKALPDIDKAELVNEILSQLQPPDPEVFRAWEEEVARRVAAADAGDSFSVPYEDVIGKYLK